MYMRVDVALSRQAVYEAIRQRIAAGKPMRLDDLAADTSCSTRTVARAIRDLKNTEQIKVIQRGTRYVATEYEIVDGTGDAPTGGE
jgi:DNA-binding transcriptional regulator YhcF (GntR family)